jgi:hypothetical protein
MIRANKLKHFIKKIEHEIFRNQELPIYIITPTDHRILFPEKKTSPASLSAGYGLLLKPFGYALHLGLFLEYIVCVLIYQRYKGTHNPDHRTLRKKKISMLESARSLRVNKIFLNGPFYEIFSVADFFSTANDLQLFEVALHEVRHRVQENGNYINVPANLYSNLLSSLRAQKKLKENIAKSYKPKQVEIEIDAFFTALYIRKEIEKEYPLSLEISEELLSSFISRFRNIILWRNPDME